MSFDLIPRNPSAGVLGKPNGFWPALMCETPAGEPFGCKYKDESESIIVYEHDGYVGEKWFSADEAEQIMLILLEYVKTDDYRNHRYFSERQNQMEYFMNFLPVCGGFKFEM